MWIFPPLEYFCNIGGWLCHSMHKLHILFDFLYKVFNLKNIIYAKKSILCNFATKKVDLAQNAKFWGRRGGR